MPYNAFVFPVPLRANEKQQAKWCLPRLAVDEAPVLSPHRPTSSYRRQHFAIVALVVVVVQTKSAIVTSSLIVLFPRHQRQRCYRIPRQLRRPHCGSFPLATHELSSSSSPIPLIESDAETPSITHITHSSGPKYSHQRTTMPEFSRFILSQSFLPPSGAASSEGILP